MTCLARFCSPARTSSQITRPHKSNLSNTTSPSSATNTSPSSATLCRWRFYNRRASIRTQIKRFCAQFDVLPAIRTQIGRFCARFAIFPAFRTQIKRFCARFDVLPAIRHKSSINTYFPDNQSSWLSPKNTASLNLLTNSIFTINESEIYNSFIGFRLIFKHFDGAR